MKQIVTISILDTNLFFSQGLEAVLRHHFSHRNIPVHFLPKKHCYDAALLFMGGSLNHSIKFCRQRQGKDLQRVVTVKDINRFYSTHRHPCLSEQGVIHRHMDVNKLLLDVEVVLAKSPVTATFESCPRCTQVLTPREEQVLSALGYGLRHKQIAWQMGLSVKTISAHKRSAMIKLGFTRSSDLNHWLGRGGLNYEIREFS